MEEQRGKRVQAVTADAGYGRAQNYAGLEELKVAAVVVPRGEAGAASKLPIRRFKYDGRH